ncbi:MAG: hypothetical protein MZW92_59135, partial [Comamonadaceae bacterium]|nr:hypothetical protein [Comamonadaceae bacterium]
MPCEPMCPMRIARSSPSSTRSTTRSERSRSSSRSAMERTELRERRREVPRPETDTARHAQRALGFRCRHTHRGAGAVDSVCSRLFNL